MRRALSLVLVSSLVGVLRSELFQVDNNPDFLDDIDEMLDENIEDYYFQDDIGKGSILL